MCLSLRASGAVQARGHGRVAVQQQQEVWKAHRRTAGGGRQGKGGPRHHLANHGGHLFPADYASLSGNSRDLCSTLYKVSGCTVVHTRFLVTVAGEPSGSQLCRPDDISSRARDLVAADVHEPLTTSFSHFSSANLAGQGLMTLRGLSNQIKSLQGAIAASGWIHFEAVTTTTTSVIADAYHQQTCWR